ncbi:hypothetical protein SAMN05192574_105281 [Mucilaginibacter gossypiicola]|uniref:Uncharacterized protein n=1 Tax=Mucilaginibacter gossypiicola TaxID=551995 RepID=A0A1H8LWH6_9SPHI|nr:hypothetical protein [Mucilaginibacter gossypiicola]SEO09467.1 hypothetical protein SAMN05192574_105281 [Mucilaginibacter gossypiicola]
MPQVKSYLDTTLRIIHINRYSGMSPESTDAMRQYLKESETSAPIRREFITRHLSMEHQSNEEMLRVLAHEFHHYLQGLFYPFLYYLSWLELDNLMYLGNQLKDSTVESFPISSIHMNDDFFRNYYFLHQLVEFYIEKSHLKIRIPETETYGSNVFTLNDLLEDATTIFEYRIYEENPTAEGFEKWINNPANNCYKKTYRFLKTLLGRENTFNLLPLIVQAAFSCTDPLSGFSGAVSYINIRGLDYKRKSMDELFNEVMSFLESKMGRIILDPKKHHFLMTIPVSTVHYEDMELVTARADGEGGALHFPLNKQFKKVVARIKNEPGYQTRILQANKATFQELLKEYYPFAIHYHYKDFDGRNGSIVMGEDYRDSITPLGLTYPFYVKELIKIKETQLALFSRIHSSIDNNCHHRDCSYYSLGLCKLWNSIPLDFNDCGFPQFFAYLFYRKINLANKTLIKISKEEADANYEEYGRRTSKSRSFEYKLLNPGYLLTIDAQDIKDERTKTMFPDFIAYLKDRYRETSQSLFSSISLDFYGYNHDARPIFSIPAVVEFIKASKMLVPELLYYINFDSEINHKFILLPMFVEHQSKEVNGQFQIFAGTQALQNFALTEVQIWRKFLIENNIPQTDLIFKTLNKILI